MKKKTAYTDEPLVNVRVIRDFLPPPEELAFNEEKVKVTMSLSKESVEFFKAEAKKHRTSYQVMIRKLLDFYASQHRPS
ncbi:MAG: BrnA antitoxin family protein [Mariprofundaceae bacterium]